MFAYHFSYLTNPILLMVFSIRVAKIRIPNDVEFLFLSLFLLLIKAGYAFQLSFLVRKISILIRIKKVLLGL